jgi:hypothetical protein
MDAHIFNCYNIAYKSYIDNEPIKSYMKTFIDSISVILNCVGSIWIIDSSGKKEQIASSLNMSLNMSTTMSTNINWNEEYSDYVSYNHTPSGFIAMVPFVYNQNIIGLMGLCWKNNHNNHLKYELYHLINPMGMLFYGALNFPTKIQPIIKNELVNKLAIDGLNNLELPIAIIDKHLMIVFKNEQWKGLFNTNYPNLSDELCLLDIFPQAIFMISNHIIHTNFFKNKKIDVLVKNTNDYFELSISTFSSMDDFFHIITIQYNDKSRHLANPPSKNSTNGLQNSPKRLSNPPNGQNIIENINLSNNHIMDMESTNIYDQQTYNPYPTNHMDE